MRGWSSIFAGFLLLGVAYVTYTLDGFGTMTWICGGAAAMFFLRGAFGLEVGASGGAAGLLEFIQDPADAIVDSATDKLADWLKEDEPQAAAVATPAASAPEPKQPKVVAEGAMERYFAQRDAELAAAPSAAPLRSFGRKGL